jgi:hypothetical protein
VAPLPKPESRITGMIYAAYEADAENWDGLGFSMSELHNECERALWYQVRWAAARENFTGRMLRLFETGHREEARIIAELRRIGLEVHDVDPDTGKQFLARALAGHVRGKLDGMALGVPEAPAAWHVVEAKSHNDKSFKALVKAGVGKLREAKPEHWAQCQMYMHIRGLERCLYTATNKNDDSRWNDRVYYDPEWCTRTLAKLERILRMPEPPSRIVREGRRFPLPLLQGEAALP